MNIDLARLKNKHRSKKNNKKSIEFKFNVVIVKLILTIVLTIITLLVLRSNTNLKTIFYKNVYDNHISFALINDLYQRHFGSPLPFRDLFSYTQPVFNEQLRYTAHEEFKDGGKLTVGAKYLVPVLESGIVIFVGYREGYGSTVIIQQANGIDVWYSNFSEINVRLYDYVTRGSLLGEVDRYLYLVFIKDGEVLDYTEHI